MKVLIVAKTKMSQACCVGGLDAKNASLRLYHPGGICPPVDSPYHIGQIWEMTVKPAPSPRPPHLEDVVVKEKRYLYWQNNLTQHLLRRIEPWTGGIHKLFQGDLLFTNRGRGYIESPSIPTQSTWFWLSDLDLHHTLIEEKSYYSYNGRYHLPYVGFEQPEPVLPAGTLLRVSLARWWKPEDADQTLPERCYLQLSGWYT